METTKHVMTKKNFMFSFYFIFTKYLFMCIYLKTKKGKKKTNYSSNTNGREMRITRCCMEWKENTNAFEQCHSRCSNIKYWQNKMLCNVQLCSARFLHFGCTFLSFLFILFAFTAKKKRIKFNIFYAYCAIQISTVYTRWEKIYGVFFNAGDDLFSLNFWKNHSTSDGIGSIN